MARQSSGVYQAPANTAAVSGQPISSAKVNTLTGDLGNEITNSLDRLGRGSMQANLSMGGFKITDMADPTTSLGAATKQYVDAATQATASGEFVANTAGKLLTPAAVWADAEEKTVTISTTTYTPDFSLGSNFILGTTQTGNFTLANPTNVKVGQSGTIRIVQDATGGRTWTLGSNWKKAATATAVLSTTPNATDLMHYKVITSSMIEYSLSKAVG